MARARLSLSFLAFVLAVASFVAPAESRAAGTQQAAGAMAGSVADKSGGALPGASVIVTNSQTQATAMAVTDGQGRFRFDGLAPGRYRVEASLSGFDRATETVVVDATQAVTLDFALAVASLTESIVVSARRVEETAQEVPIALSVIGAAAIADTAAFNVNRLKEQIPTVQVYSTNPRNSSVNIRGLGAPFGLTNDGIEPGVGLYVDGVFYARPAAAALDLLDVDRIEVLRGPQGTLFGKNTTAGAINVTTRKPSFTTGSDVEMTYGNFGFTQAKASVTGPLGQHAAARASFSGTRRDGTVYNVARRHAVNTLNNLGVRGQLLLTPSTRIAIALSADHTRQRPEGYTQVVAGVAPTLRPANRQYAQIAADLGYAPPSFNAFDRLTDVDTPLRSDQDLGGSSANIDVKLGPGLLTATSAYRYWHWNPSSDRDFTGLPVTTISAAPSTQRQWTQEVRYAGSLTSRVNLIVGVFTFRQTIDSDPSFTQEQGAAAARFLLPPTDAAATPGLLDGYGYDQTVRFANTSSALFSQATLTLTKRVRVLPGLRVNHDRKDVDFRQQVYGGLQTSTPSLILLQRSILAPQAYWTDTDDTNLSGQLTVAYDPAERVHAYGSYATSFKSVGLNLNGVPTDGADRPVLAAATVKPEHVRHVEAGVKTEPWRGVTANFTMFNTEIADFQAQVVNAGVGVLRGYLANAEKVRVRGAEVDASARIGAHIAIAGSAAYTDGRYLTFRDAPPPLEDTGGPQVKDISGSVLPGISRWAASISGEYTNRGAVLGRSGEYFVVVDASGRSSFSSSPSASRYLVVPGYGLLNVRVGFRWADGWTVSLWARNLLNKNYYELLTAAPGNTGLYVGQPGDSRTVGVTLRLSLKSK